MLRLSNISLPLDFTDHDLRETAARKLRLPPSSILDISLVRRSIDARDKGDVHFVTSLDVQVAHEDTVLKKCKSSAVRSPESFLPIIPASSLSFRPLIVGAGPSGLFAALILAQSGAKPIVIERGRDVDSRTAGNDSSIGGGRLGAVEGIDNLCSRGGTNGSQGDVKGVHTHAAGHTGPSGLGALAQRQAVVGAAGHDDIGRRNRIGR